MDNQEKNPEPQTSQTPQPVSPPIIDNAQSIPKRSLSLISKIFITLGIVVALVILVAVGSITYFFTIGCNNRIHTAQLDSNKFVKQYQNLQIAGNTPNNVSGSFNKDCVDGLGSVSVSTVYNVAPTSVENINNQVLNSLNLNTFSKAPFISMITDQSTNEAPPTGTEIYTVSSYFYTNNRTTYTINYHLENPAICQTYNSENNITSPYCINNGYITTNYNLYNQVTNKVTIIAAIPIKT